MTGRKMREMIEVVVVIRRNHAALILFAKIRRNRA